MGFTAWFPGVPLRRKQPATGGEGPGSIQRHPHQMSPLPFAAEKAVAQKVQQGGLLSLGRFLHPPPSPQLTGLQKGLEDKAVDACECG